MMIRSGTHTTQVTQSETGAQPRGAFGAFAPLKFSKHCIAILRFEETFK